MNPLDALKTELVEAKAEIKEALKRELMIEFWSQDAKLALSNLATWDQANAQKWFGAITDLWGKS